MARLATCQRGTAEGLVVLTIGPDDDPEMIAREISGRPGLWAVMLDGEIDLSGERGAEVVEAIGDMPVVSTVDLADPPATWPACDVEWIADATALLRGTDSELAARLGSIPWLPPARDLFADLESDQHPPSAGALSMLETAVRATCCYLYLPRDYLYRETVIRNVATSATPWAVRWR